MVVAGRENGVVVLGSGYWNLESASVVVGGKIRIARVSGMIES